MPVTLFGIRNCVTMKKARARLDAHGIEYAFRDDKTAGLDEARLQAWIDALGWDPCCLPLYLQYTNFSPTYVK
jgi:arsenate reductase